MDLKALFKNCLGQASNVVSQVKTSQFKDPTPDTEWDVAALTRHMLYELSWVADILDGKTVAEVGNKYDTDLIGNDLKKNWQAAADKALASLDRVGLNQPIHLSYGDFKASHYIQEQANDQLIHAWDLGSAIGVEVKFDPDIAEFLYQAALPRQSEMAATGLFAPAIKVPASADIQTKLLALFGRR
jgi:uncharacterized protein (TIGR03086 family)